MIKKIGALVACVLVAVLVFWLITRAVVDSRYQSGLDWGIRPGVTAQECEVRDEVEGPNWVRGCLDSVERRRKAG